MFEHLCQIFLCGDWCYTRSQNAHKLKFHQKELQMMMYRRD
jgi:hypothetical protein